MIIVTHSCIFRHVFPTLGTELRREPMSVTIVSTVVMPSATRAGTASLEIQNDSHDKITINNVGE